MKRCRIRAHIFDETRAGRVGVAGRDCWKVGLLSRCLGWVMALPSSLSLSTAKAAVPPARPLYA